MFSTRAFLMPFMMLAELSAAEVLLPVMSGIIRDREHVTSIVVSNPEKVDGQCTFAYRNFLERESVPAGKTRVFEKILADVAALGTLRMVCPPTFEIVARIQDSIDGGITFRDGSVYRPLVRMDGGSKTIHPRGDVLFAEVGGRRASVLVTTWDGDVITRSTTQALEPHALGFVRFPPGSLNDNVSVRLEVAAGSAVAVGEDDPALTQIGRVGSSKQATATTSSSPAGIERKLLVSAFKGAPFQEPMTGLIFMRDRWYDPRSGSFLTPDRARFRDSSNLYTYCGGDPVNCEDPTGMYGLDFHYYVIYFLSRAAGLGVGAASDVAWSSQYVDNAWESNPIWNSLNGRSEIVRLLHFVGPPGVPVKQDNPFVNRLVSEAALTGNPIRFGITLHSLADSFSHEGFTHTWDRRNVRTGVYSGAVIGTTVAGRAAGFPMGEPSLPGHLGADQAGHANDYPYRDVEKAINASRVIFRHMQDFARVYYGRSMGTQTFEDIESRLRILFAIPASDSMRVALWKGEIARQFEDTTYRREDTFGPRRHFKSLLLDQIRKAGSVTRP